MLIDNGKKYRDIFCEVVEDCIIGKTTKEQALMLLESRYNTELERIKVNEKNNPDVFHILKHNGELHSVKQIHKPINADTGKEIDLLELYNNCLIEFKECFNDYKAEIEALPDEQNLGHKIQIRNELIPKMIGEGILMSDGERPSKSLDRVAIFLVDNGQEPTVNSLIDLGLKQRNGKQYSKRAFQKAISVAYTR